MNKRLRKFRKVESEYAYTCRYFSWSVFRTSDVMRLQVRAINYLRNAVKEVSS